MKVALRNKWPERIHRLQLPEREADLGHSVGQGERQLSARTVGREYVDLTYADTKRFPPFPSVIDRFVKAATGGGKTYTPYRGERAIREQVAANVSRFLGLPVDPDRELILTPGTQAGLFTALAALVDRDETVLVMDPDYLTNERMVRFFGGKVIRIPLLWEGVSEPTPDFDALEKALAHRPRLLWFSNPNNPTGAVYSPEVLGRIADVVRRSDMWVIVDELYSRLVYDGRPFQHFAALEGMGERTVTVLGPSKTESMSGYRLGVAVAPAQAINYMEDVLAISVLRAPAYAQHTLLDWLGNDDDYIRQRVEEYQKLRDYTVERLKECENVEVVPAQGTAYMFPRVNADVSDQELATRLLEEAGALINPGYQFGPRGVGHFRICFAQDEKVWEQVLDRMIGVLSSLPKKARVG